MKDVGMTNMVFSVLYSGRSSLSLDGRQLRQLPKSEWARPVWLYPDDLYGL